MSIAALLPFFMAADEPPAPVGALRHTYSITVGTHGSGIRGYWFNNIGNISNSAYALPNGVNAIIRQTMLLTDGDFRFLVSSGGATTSSLDQFPTRIEIQRNADIASFTRKSPVEIASFGQGIGMDFELSSGNAAAILTNNTTVTCRLYY